MTEDIWQRSSMSRRTTPRRSPWCPSEEDGRFMLEAAGPVLAGGERATLLVLGVTPEVIALPWPSRASLVAIDSSAGMIASSWQPNPDIESQVVCAWWQDMPIAGGSVAAAVGDGSLNALTTFDDYPVVLAQVARVLRPGGIVALRCFVQAEPRESVVQLFADARRRRFVDIAGFRFRVSMAVAGADGSMVLDDLPAAFATYAPDRDEFSATTGWSRREIDVADGAGSPVRITFPTEAELRGAFEPWFDLQEMRHGHYVEADRCPTAILRRR